MAERLISFSPNYSEVECISRMNTKTNIARSTHSYNGLRHEQQTTKGALLCFPFDQQSVSENISLSNTMIIN